MWQSVFFPVFKTNNVKLGASRGFVYGDTKHSTIQPSTSVCYL